MMQDPGDVNRKVKAAVADGSSHLQTEPPRLHQTERSMLVLKEPLRWWDLAFWIQLSARPSPTLCIAHSERPGYRESLEQAQMHSYLWDDKQLVVDDHMVDPDFSQAMARLNMQGGLFWSVGKTNDGCRKLEVLGLGPNIKKRRAAIKCGLALTHCISHIPDAAEGTGAFAELLLHLQGVTAWASVPDRFIQWHKAALRDEKPLDR